MLVNDFFDKVVVINLDRRIDRMEKITQQLNELDIKHERYSAIDGLGLGINPVNATKDSHVAVWRQSIDKNVLILEDDAFFCHDFIQRFDNHINSLPDNWDILYLGGMLNQSEPVNDFWAKPKHMTGLQAYCINHKAIPSLINSLENFNYHIDIGLVFASGYNQYVAIPNLVTQFPSYSDLRLREVNDFDQK